MKSRQNSVRVSILFVNYYSEADIIRNINAIDSVLGNDAEFIVVDNSHTFEKFYEKYSANVKIINNPEGNSGFGRGMNLASKNVRASFIFMINPDIFLPSPVVVKDLVDRLEAAPDNVGSVSCKINFPDGRNQAVSINNCMPKPLQFFYSQLANALHPLFKGFVRHKRRAERIGSLGNKPTPVVGFYAAFVLFRKEAFCSVNGFDEDFFMYCEDTELFRRRFLTKWVSWFFEDVSVVHVTSKSDVFGLMDSQKAVSFLLYLRKFSLAHLFIFLSIRVPRALLMLLFRRHQHEAWATLRALQYLPEIIRRHDDNGKSRKPLKIREILD